MSKLTESIFPKGTVKWEIIKANGTATVHEPDDNTIHADIKNSLGASMIAQQSNFGCMNSPFLDDDFTEATSGNSGLVMKDDDPLFYGMETSLESTGGLTFTLKGILRSEDDYTITDGYLGHSWNTGTNDFDVAFSSYNFSPDVVLEDGDQLNVTWEITIADS